MIESVGADWWQDRVFEAWLHGLPPVDSSRRLTSVEPVGAELDEVNEIRLGYTDRVGSSHVLAVGGADLDDLRRFYEDADYPMEY